jgi:hypothetical protein
LNIDATTLVENAPADPKQVIDWKGAFPESDHGPIWLKALEAGYQERLLGHL